MDAQMFYKIKVGDRISNGFEILRVVAIDYVFSFENKRDEPYVITLEDGRNIKPIDDLSQLNPVD